MRSTFLLFASFCLLTSASAHVVFAQSSKIKIVILGDSLTEGYGVPKESAFPAVLEKKLKAEGHSRVEVINAGISGSTTASGLSRLKWILKSKPQILILALGANDGLRGVKVQETKKNLASVIELAQENHLRIILAGMKLPPNLGKDYTKSFENIFAELAREKKALFIPFLLEGVGGNPKLNQSDGMHPNEAGHAIVAETVKKYIELLL